MIRLDVVWIKSCKNQYFQLHLIRFHKNAETKKLTLPLNPPKSPFGKGGLDSRFGSTAYDVFEFENSYAGNLT